MSEWRKKYGAGEKKEWHNGMVILTSHEFSLYTTKTRLKSGVFPNQESGK
jgi:hypothetical protein